MNHRIGAGLLAVAVIGLGWSLVQGEPGSPASPHHAPESALMRAKVASSHKVMEGLVTKNFVDIRKGAEELQRICNATEWRAHADPQYAHYRSELYRQAIKLINSAERSNLDGATFAYLNTVTTCVNCHDHCRDVLKIANVRQSTKIIPIPTTESEDVASEPKTIRR